MYIYIIIYIYIYNNIYIYNIAMDFMMINGDLNNNNGGY
jgi:hypothetical protein